jgi:hypothetical protein
VLLLIGGSLGAGPWRCNPLAPPEPGFGGSFGSAFGAAPGSDSDSGGSSLPSPTSPTLPTRPTPPPPTPPPSAPSPAAPAIATTPHRDEPTPRETLRPKQPPPSPRVVVPDEVILAAVRALQPTFAACWRRAQRTDPALTSARIRLSLELDASGAVTSSRTDAEDAKLSACLANVARKLPFPAPGRPAAFDIPLYF